MKTTGVVVLMLLLIVFLILLIPYADKFTPARSTGTSVTSSVTTILIPPSVKLSSLDNLYGTLRGNILLSNPNNFASQTPRLSATSSRPVES